MIAEKFDEFYLSELQLEESPVSAYEKNLLAKEAEIVKLENFARETIHRASKVSIFRKA